MQTNALLLGGLVFVPYAARPGIACNIVYQCILIPYSQLIKLFGAFALRKAGLVDESENSTCIIFYNVQYNSTRGD